MKYLRLELKKLFHVPAYRYLLGLGVGMVVLLNMVTIYQWLRSLPLVGVDDFVNTVYVLRWFVSLSSIVIGAQFVASEYTSHTILRPLTVGVSRKSFLAGKIIALIIGVYVLFWVLSFIALLIAAMLGVLVGGFPWGNVSLLHLVFSWLLLPLTLVPILSITIFLALVFRSSIVPIVSLLLYITIGEPILSLLLNDSVLATLLNFLPGKIGNPLEAITLALINTAPVTELLLPTSSSQALWGALVGIMAYVGLLGCGAYIVFRKQDIL